MITLAAVLERVGGLEEAELVAWIERRWVRAEPAAGGYAFEEVDIARIRLIHEIRRECAVDDEALDVVLSLLDQVYRLRRQLKALSGAVASQPEAVRARILAALAAREAD
jgi:chaperone modulatory protein CbpM